VTSLPTVLPPRVVASARRHDLPHHKLADGTLFIGRDPVVSIPLTPDSLGVRIDLSGPVPPRDVGAARDLMDRLLAAGPAPTISLSHVDESEGAGSEAGEPGAPEAPAATGRLYVRIEAVTPVEEGMTDAQLDAYLAWATALTDRCAAAFEKALPLTRAGADKED